MKLLVVQLGRLDERERDGLDDVSRVRRALAKLGGLWRRGGRVSGEVGGRMRAPCVKQDTERIAPRWG